MTFLMTIGSEVAGTFKQWHKLYLMFSLVCRLNMGIPDKWFGIVESMQKTWPMQQIADFLCDRRKCEKSVAYVECHDQCLVGGQTLGEFTVWYQIYTLNWIPILLMSLVNGGE